MAKHMAANHSNQDQPPKFEAKVLATHKSCLTRLLDESIRIDKEEATLANSKSEWGTGMLVRPVTNKRSSYQSSNQPQAEGSRYDNQIHGGAEGQLPGPGREKDPT